MLPAHLNSFRHSEDFTITNHLHCLADGNLDPNLSIQMNKATRFNQRKASGNGHCIVGRGVG